MISRHLRKATPCSPSSSCRVSGCSVTLVSNGNDAGERSRSVGLITLLVKVYPVGNGDRERENKMKKLEEAFDWVGIDYFIRQTEDKEHIS